jgi:site-specific recombinase XerD
LRWLAQAGHLSQDPSRTLVFKKLLQAAPRRLTWQEVQAILTAHDRGKNHGLRDAAYLNVMVELDLEVRTCSALQLADVSKLTLEPPTRELLEAYIHNARAQWVRASAASKFLFLNHQGAQMGPLRASKIVDEAAELAGVPRPVGVKCLRGSYREALGRKRRIRLPFSLNRGL